MEYLQVNETISSYNLVIDQNTFNTSYDVGESLDLDFDLFLNIEYEDNSASQLQISSSECEIYFAPYVDAGEPEWILLNDEYILNDEGVFQIKASYTSETIGEVESNLILLQVTNQSNYIIYYVIVAVVAIFVVAIGVITRKLKKSGYFAKKAQADQELVEKYKKELEEQEKKKEENNDEKTDN